MDPPPPGGDEKWKLSKKGRSRSGRPHAMDAGSSSSSSSVLSRSYSATVTTTRGAAAAAGASSSQQQQSSRLSKKKCVDAVKEHRARFYIVRRCVSMLVCWRDY
ncbi:unnamed protein product [Urochloa humidicola]